MIGKHSCASCVFWQHRPELAPVANNQRSGSCRRHAPGVFAQPGTGKAITRWPLTVEHDACGDHSTDDVGRGD